MPLLFTVTREKKNEGNELLFPEGMSHGYWKTFDDALAYFKKYCAVGNNPLGGWGVNKSTPLPANTQRGQQHKILCSCHKNPEKQGVGEKQTTQIGTACKWKVVLEESTQGWMVYNANFVHNHPLSQSLAEANAGGVHSLEVV